MSREFWLSVAPLLLFNLVFLSTLFYFWVTYYKTRQKIADVEREMDAKEHSRFLSRFLKEYWYWLTSPFEKKLVQFRLSPNTITLIGFFLCCLSGYFFHLRMFGMGGWFMIFGATFDMFDGRVARLTNHVTKSGAFFDSVMDRFSEAVVFLGLAAAYRNSWLLNLVVIALIGSMMVSYTRARGEGVGIVCSVGWMQRPERIVYLGVGSIFSPIFAYFLSHWIQWVHIPEDFMTIGALLIIGLFTNLTAIARMRFIMRQLDQ